MQVLSQGPSLLLVVWTGLALLEGGESVCSYSCGEFKEFDSLVTFISKSNVLACVCVCVCVLAS